MPLTSATFILLIMAVACQAAPLGDQCVTAPSNLRPGGCRMNVPEGDIGPQYDIYGSDPRETLTTLTTFTGATSSHVPSASTQVNTPLPSEWEKPSIHPWFGHGLAYPPASLLDVHDPPDRSLTRHKKRVFVEQASSMSAAVPASTSIPFIGDICRDRPPHLHMWNSDPNDPICPHDEMAPRMHVGRGNGLPGPME